MKLLDGAAVPFQVVMTKSDKVRQNDRDAALARTRSALAKHPAAFPEIILTSSEIGEGIPTLRATIAGMS